MKTRSIWTIARKDLMEVQQNSMAWKPAIIVPFVFSCPDSGCDIGPSWNTVLFKNRPLVPMYPLNKSVPFLRKRSWL